MTPSLSGGQHSYPSSTRQEFLQGGGFAAAGVLAAMGFSSGMAFGGEGPGAKMAVAATTGAAVEDSTTLLQKQASTAVSEAHANRAFSLQAWPSNLLSTHASPGGNISLLCATAECVITIDVLGAA